MLLLAVCLTVHRIKISLIILVSNSHLWINVVKNQFHKEQTFFSSKFSHEKKYPTPYKKKKKKARHYFSKRKICLMEDKVLRLFLMKKNHIPLAPFLIYFSHLYLKMSFSVQNETGG